MYQYYLEPDYTEITRMKKEDAKKIMNFTIGNKYGKVTWEGHTNLLEILCSSSTSFPSLSHIISIDKHSVTVYPDDEQKPSRGRGLNRPAVVWVFGLYPRGIKSKLVGGRILNDSEIEVYEQFKGRLRELVRDKGGVFMSYDGRTGEL